MRSPENKNNHPQKEGKTVLLVPGMCGPELTLCVVKKRLEEINHKPVYLHHVLPLNTVFGMERPIERKAEELAEENNGPITIFGHSLGGRMAIRVAQKRPELFDQIIAAGSPVADIRKKPKDVWVTNLISWNDPIVPIWASYNKRFDNREFVGISHVGLILSKRVFRAVAHSLES